MPTDAHSQGRGIPSNLLSTQVFTFMDGTNIARCLHLAVLLPHNLELFDGFWDVFEPLYLNCYGALRLDAGGNKVLVQFLVHGACLAAVQTAITYYTSATDTAARAIAMAADDRSEVAVRSSSILQDLQTQSGLGSSTAIDIDGRLTMTLTFR